jgi:predicted DNA binding protein
MLRQVSLTVETPNDFQDLARKYGADISVVDCKDFNSKGMTMLIDLHAPEAKVKHIMSDLQKVKGIRKVYYTKKNHSGAMCFAVLDRPVLCRSVLDSGVLCVNCPYNMKGSSISWDVLVKDSSSLKKLLDELVREKVPTQIKGVSDASREELLTSRQKEVLVRALELGYFEFPRKIDLTELALELMVKPSTLSEILRNAQRKIVDNYLDKIKAPAHN